MKLHEYLKQFEGLDPDTEVVLPCGLHEDEGSNVGFLDFEAYSYAFSFEAGNLAYCDTKKSNLYNCPVIFLGGL